MTASPGEGTTGQVGPSFPLKKAFFPIDEYAAQEGIPREMVEKCGELGIFQLRRHKGRTFVVESGIRGLVEDGGMGGEEGPAGEEHWEASRLSDLASNLASGGGEKMERPVQKAVEAVEQIEAGTIAGLVEKMSSRAAEITGSPMEKIEKGAAEEKKPAERKRESFKRTDSRIREVAGRNRTSGAEVGREVRRAGAVSGGAVEISKRAAMAAEPSAQAYRATNKGQSAEEAGIDLGELNSLAGSGRVWRTVAFLSLIFLFVAAFCVFWLYLDRGVRVDEVYVARLNVGKVREDARRQTELLRERLADSETEVARLQGELRNSRGEVKAVWESLAEAEAELETVRKRHIEAVEQLSMQTRMLEIQLREFGENSQ